MNEVLKTKFYDLVRRAAIRLKMIARNHPQRSDLVNNTIKTIFTKKSCPMQDCHYPNPSCYIKEPDSCGHQTQQSSTAKHTD